MSKAFLQQLPLFKDISADDLDRLYTKAEPVVVQPGQIVMAEGDPGDALYILLDGQLEITKQVGQRTVLLAICTGGEFIGEMALLTQAPRSATVRATRASRLLRISQAVFQEVLVSSSQATLAVLHAMTARLQNLESLTMHDQKMAALGTLAAGLAHEINNPAAAIRRATDQLRDTLAEWERLSGELSSRACDSAQLEAINGLRSELVRRSATAAVLDPLDRLDREDAVQTWLEDQAVDQAWELAPALVVYGWNVEELETIAAGFVPRDVPLVVRWLGTGSSLSTLLDEVSQSATAITELVGAVKNYSYLDQAPIQDVDVHASLEHTLVILRHKLKAGVRIKRGYAPDLPHIEAYGSELNQVWTNIVDNAIDAMAGQGDLGLRTCADDATVTVEISDTGSGIPPELRARIFDPFFTTKGPGSGTGLGLHIAYTIVVNKHQGEIKVISRPGSTCFKIILPRRRAGSHPTVGD